MANNLKILLLFFICASSFAAKWDRNAATPFLMIGSKSQKLTTKAYEYIIKAVKEKLESEKPETLTEDLKDLENVDVCLTSDSFRNDILIPVLDRFTRLSLLKEGEGKFIAEMVAGFRAYEIGVLNQYEPPPDEKKAPVTVEEGKKRQKNFKTYLAEHYGEFLKNNPKFVENLFPSQDKKDSWLWQKLKYPSTIKGMLIGVALSTCAAGLIAYVRMDHNSTSDQLHTFQNAPAEVKQPPLDAEKEAEKLGERLPD